MNIRNNRLFAALTILSLMVLGLMLAGCSDDDESSTPVVVSKDVVSGTAANGTPLSGQISIKDSSVPPKQRSTEIGSDGTFAIDVTGMTAPFVLQAKGNDGGNEYRMQTFANGKGIANINPLSNICVGSAAGDDNPDDAFDKADFDKCRKIKNNLEQSVSVLMAKLQPLLKHYNSERNNPITARYIANHLDLDEMFDNVKITVSNGIITIINRKSKAVIFTGALRDIANGIFDGGAIPSTPATPTGVAALAGTDQVTLTWTPVSGATAYNVYYSTTPGVTKNNATKISSVNTPYVQTGLTTGTTYYFVVTAIIGVEESAASPQVSAVTTSTPPVATLPVAPAGVIATGGTNQSAISWGAVNTATSYNVYYSTTSGVTMANGTKIANATSPTVLTGLPAATTYYYVVSAINSMGEGPASVQVTATTLPVISDPVVPTPPVIPTPTAPVAPTGVTATGGANQATINWTAVPGATSYNVYYSTSSGVTTANGTRIANATSPYTLSGLAAGATYYVIVTAVNSTGEGAASAQASAATNAAAAACGSCHAIPPALGAHSAHSSIGCATCHGAGYSATTVNAATHINGVKDVTISIWNPATRSCAAQCHSARAW